MRMRILSSFFVAIALCVCVETAAAQTDLNRTMEEFDALAGPVPAEV